MFTHVNHYYCIVAATTTKSKKKSIKKIKRRNEIRKSSYLFFFCHCCYYYCYCCQSVFLTNVAIWFVEMQILTWHCKYLFKLLNTCTKDTHTHVSKYVHTYVCVRVCVCQLRSQTNATLNVKSALYFPCCFPAPPCVGKFCGSVRTL